MQHQHWVNTVWNLLQKVDFGAAKVRMAAHKCLQPTFLLLGGPFSEQHHPDHMQKGHSDHIIYVDTAITEQADFALHVRYCRFSDNNSG